MGLVYLISVTVTGLFIASSSTSNAARTPLGAHRCGESMYEAGPKINDPSQEIYAGGQGVTMQLRQPVKFGGQSRRTLYIKNNGVIGFNGFPNMNYNQYTLPTNEAYIAPFWSDDYNWAQTGMVFYKEIDFYADRDVSSKNNFNRAEWDLIYLQYRPFRHQKNITVDGLIIITWLDVKPNRPEWTDQEGDSFQTVIMRTNIGTFVENMYGNIVSNGDHKIGIHPGKSSRNLFQLDIQRLKDEAARNWRQDNQYKLLTAFGNTGTRGKWFYRVDVPAKPSCPPYAKSTNLCTRTIYCKDRNFPPHVDPIEGLTKWDCESKCQSMNTCYDRSYEQSKKRYRGIRG